MNCKHYGTYEGNIIIPMPLYWTTAKKRFFGVDVCIASKILDLIFHYGIRTIECCCGHGEIDGYVAVDKHNIRAMKGLGYKLIKGKDDIFIIPKETIVHYEYIKE